MASKKPQPAFYSGREDGLNFAVMDKLIAQANSQNAKQPDSEGSGWIRQGLGDKALGFASGAVGAAQAISNLAGADNAASKVLGGANKGIESYLSPEAKAAKLRQAELMESARAKGFNLDGAAAGVEAFAQAPVQTMIEGAGSIVPIAAAALAGVPAAVATGIGMGAGGAKGAIFDEIKNRGIKAGLSEEEATAQAVEAQNYLGKNADQIAIGGALGAADSLTGAGKIASGMLRDAVLKPAAKEVAKKSAAELLKAPRGLFGRTAMGVASEVPLEMAQGGQEQVAANLAAQRAGYEAGTWDKVASKAIMEGLASAGPGGAFGAMHTGPKKIIPPAPTVENDKAAAEAAAAQLLAEQQAAAKKAAVDAAHKAAEAPNSPISRMVAAANPLTPEEAWAKAQELDAQAALDEANGVAPVDPAAAVPVAVQSGDPIEDTQKLIDASLAQAEQDKAAQRAAMAATESVPADPMQQAGETQAPTVKDSLQVQPEPAAQPVTAPATQQPEQFPPSQAGDILNLQGKPFKNMETAMMRQRRLGDGHEVVRVDGGLVIRPKAAAPVAAPAQEATETVAPSEVERYQWQRNAEGGQERGNQQTIQPLTEALFNEYIAPKVAVKSFPEYQQQFPAATHISLVKKGDGSTELGAGGVGPIDKLRPSAAPFEKGWVKAVDSFESPEAVAHGGSADSGVTNEIDKAAHEAATSHLNDKPQPTDGQKEAGNYAKGHITVHGMDMAIENPKGSTRSGVSPDGTEWSNTMGGHYGYFKGTEGNDGDHVDGYVGPNPESNRVFVIDQVNKDGSFDEHKAMIGYDTPEQAREAYMSSFMPGWTGLGAMTELPVSAFKSWVKDGVKKKPLGDISRPAPAEPVSQPQEQTSAQTAEAEQTEPQQQEATGADAEHAAEPGKPAAEPAGNGQAEVDLSTVEGVARAVQLKVATNRRKSREKSRKEREAKGYAPNSTPESEQADYEAEISNPPSSLQKQSAAAMLGTDPLPLIQMFVHGQFDASEDVFKAITGVKIRGLSAAAKKAALYQWAKWTPEQIAQAEGDVQARKDEAAEKNRQDDLKSAVMGAWLDLDRMQVKEKDGTTTTGQDFVLKSVASGFNQAHSQKTGAATVYGLTDGTRFLSLKAKPFTEFVKAAIAYGGLDKTLAYVNPPKPQAPEGFVDRSIDTADSKQAPALSALTQARNFLMELEARQEANGRIADDRLEQKIRQQKAVVKELEDAEKTAGALPSQEVSKPVQSSPSEDAITEAKATIESLDAQIKRHEELLGCLG